MEKVLSKPAWVPGGMERDRRHSQGKGVQSLAKQTAVGGELPPACAHTPGFGWRFSRKQPARRAKVATRHSRTALPALCTGDQPTNLSFSWLASLPKRRRHHVFFPGAVVLRETVALAQSRHGLLRPRCPLGVELKVQESLCPMFTELQDTGLNLGPGPKWPGQEQTVPARWVLRGFWVFCLLPQCLLEDPHTLY